MADLVLLNDLIWLKREGSGNSEDGGSGKRSFGTRSKDFKRFGLRFLRARIR